MLGKPTDPTGPGLHLDPATEARINALDLSTKEGQAAFKAELQDLERRALSGGFRGHEGEFGTFQGVQDLQGPLGEAADGLAALADATAQATRNLSNVPDLVTLQEQEFRARSAFGTNDRPGDGASLPSFPIGHPTTLHGIPVEVPGIPAPGINESRIGLDGTKVADPITAALGKLSGGSSLKDLVDALMPQSAGALSAATPGGRVFNQYGAVTVIVQGADKDPAEVARLVKAEFIRGTLASTGQEDLF